MHLNENQYNRDIRHYMNIRNVGDKHHRDCIKDLKIINNIQSLRSFVSIIVVIIIFDNCSSVLIAAIQSTFTTAKYCAWKHRRRARASG